MDGAGLFCGRIQLPFDDHLAKVRVPVLELGAAGGFGTKADYSTTLVGSKDVTRLVVRLLPGGQEATDFGYVDLWQARNAPQAGLGAPAPLAPRPLITQATIERVTQPGLGDPCGHIRDVLIGL